MFSVGPTDVLDGTIRIITPDTLISSPSLREIGQETFQDKCLSFWKSTAGIRTSGRTRIHLTLYSNLFSEYSRPFTVFIKRKYWYELLQLCYIVALDIDRKYSGIRSLSNFDIFEYVILWFFNCSLCDLGHGGRNSGVKWFSSAAVTVK